MNIDKQLDIIVPCFNEEKNLDIFTQKLLETIKKINIKYKIIFVDDGSKDTTWNKISNLSKDNKNIYHHIGIYSYKTSILEKFVRLNQTKNEKENKLEQLRALDNKLKINVALAKSSPVGVDTQEDYLAIKKIMEYKS